MTAIPSSRALPFRLVRTSVAVAFSVTLLGCDAGAELPMEPGSTAASLAGGRWSAWSEPVPVEGINTAALETRAALSRNQLSLYFHSNRLGGLGRNDLWVSRRDCVDCPWQAPVNLGSVVNTAAFNEAAPALSRDEHWLFFTGPGPQARGDIWMSYRPDVHDDLGWGPPVNLGPNVNSAAGESQPSYFENEGGRAQLYFVRGGLGIHVSELLEDGTWGPAAAVPGLAAFNGPSLHPNGREIYVFELFKDHRIWRATRESPDAPWSPPVELADLTPGVASVFQPFIHAHGGTETLFMAGIPAPGEPPDLYVTTRTR